VSEENKLTTNQIEKVLLEKKQKEFSNELSSAIEKLDEVLCKYVGRVSQDEFKIISAWLSQKVLTTQYPHYSKNYFASNLHSDYYPKILNEVLLKKAVEEFMKSVEDTKATLDDVCSSINI
jgi:hypothetical protein